MMLPPNIAAYVYAGLGAIILGLGVTTFVEHERLGKADAINAALDTKLTVSNASVTDLTKALASVNEQLTTAETNEKLLQQKVSDNLARVNEKDKSLTELEDRLQTRKPGQDCQTPKDLTDAWNSL